MLQLSSSMKVFICLDPVDFRRGIDGLAAVCRNKLTRNPMERYNQKLCLRTKERTLGKLINFP